MGKPTRVLLVDTETTGLYPERNHRVWAIGWCLYPEGDIRIEYGKVNNSREVSFFPSREFLEYLASDLPKVSHNASFDLEMLAASGWKVGGLFYDTLSMARMVGARQAGLKVFARRLGYVSEGLPEEDLKKAVNAVRLRLAHHYQVGDSWQSDIWVLREFHFAEHLVDAYIRQDIEMLAYVWEHMKLDESQWEFVERDARLIRLLHEDVQLRGICVNKEELDRQINLCLCEENEYERQFLQEVERRFHMKNVSPRSTKMLRNILFNPPPYGLGLTPDEYTESGLPRIRFEKFTDHEDKLLRALSAYHRYNHYRSSILERIKEFTVRVDRDWRVFPRFVPSGTISGRFSCHDPNLQQIPNPNTQKSASVEQPRRIFVPERGCIWLGMDFKQMEARVIAVLSEDDQMIQILMDPNRDFFSELIDKVWLKGNEDTVAMAKRILELHADTPSNELIKAYWDKVGWKPGGDDSLATNIALGWLESCDWKLSTGEKSLSQGVARGCVKAVFYTAVYGGQPKTAARSVRVSLQTAERVWDTIFSFTGLRRYWQETLSQAKSRGWVRTVFGRKIYVPLEETYKAVNYSVQGTCADMMKISMLRVSDVLRRHAAGRIVITLHDELIVEIPYERCFDQDFLRQLELAFTDFYDYIPIPMNCDFEVYLHHWGQSVAMRKEGDRWVLPLG